MTQYGKFIERLRSEGYEVRTNWQIKSDRGIIEHVSIQGRVKSIQAIFQIYGGDNGFASYYIVPGNSMDNDIDYINKLVNFN
jgi:hypothetical protein